MTVTAPELGDYLGLTEQAVRDLARKGIAVRAERGRYKLRESVRAYCESMRRNVTGRGGANTAERARLAKAQADLTEVKVRRARGELVEAAEVESAWLGVLRTVRAGMLAVPSRAAQRLPHLTASDVTVIDREVRDALSEVGNG